MKVKAVIEVFLHTAYKYLHVGGAVEGCNALTEATVFAAVLEGDYEPVAGLERIEGISIDGIQVAWVDEGGVDTLVSKQPYYILALLIE